LLITGGMQNGVENIGMGRILDTTGNNQLLEGPKESNPNQLLENGAFTRSESKRTQFHLYETRKPIMWGSRKETKCKFVFTGNDKGGGGGFILFYRNARTAGETSYVEKALKRGGCKKSSENKKESLNRAGELFFRESNRKAQSALQPA